MADRPVSLDAFIAAQQPRRLPRLGPRRMLPAGLAVASLVVLILVIARSPTAVPSSAPLIFPLPAKPVVSIVPEKPADNGTKNIDTAVPASGSGADTGSGADVGSGADTGPDADTVLPADILPVSDDPIAEILAYVDARATSLPDPSLNPVLVRAAGEERLSQFVRAAETVGLKELLEPGEPYTIFAPDDEAFAKLAAGEFDGLLEPAGQERLLTLLSQHVLPGKLNLGDLQLGFHSYTSLAGETLSIDAADVIRVGGVGIVEADLPTSNGVLYVIDQVLPIVSP